MTYLHKNKIKIRYSNNDLVFKHNNITYKGYYMETSKGRLATSSDYDNNKLLNWNQKTSDDKLGKK